MSSPCANEKRNYNFIDLFAGAGGLSEGFVQAGFHPIAHVEMNPFASQTLKTRTAYYHLKSIGKLQIYYDYLQGKISQDKLYQQIPSELLSSVFCETMSGQTLPSLFESIDGIVERDKIEKVDVIIGGPPCQAYSLVGRAQSSHMGTPMNEDPRNNLYILYVRFLKHYKPTMFVFENVVGIETANEGKTWKNIKKYMRRVGYEIDYAVQNSHDFGVLQSRKRMIIVGWLKDSGLSYPDFKKIDAHAIVNDLLRDLPKLHPGESATQYANNEPSKYLLENGLRTKDDILTLHVARRNIQRDIEIYKKAIELWNNGHQRLNYTDLPENLKTHKNQHSFLDRFKVVEGDEPCCHTMLAHISKDGHYFIHPDIDQHRSITVREAARIQSFPDSYFFEGPRTAQFVQIGNAVPPIMAKGIAQGIERKLQQGEK